MTILQRTVNFAIDVLFNGVVLYSMFLATSYAVYSLSPVGLYFNYDSVEPVSTPVYINADYILMESQFTVSLEGNLRWNDVLRCVQEDGEFAYFSQYDTSSDLVLRAIDRRVQWQWRGILPNQPAECRIESTVTRDLPFGITKRQRIISEPFNIEINETINNHNQSSSSPVGIN